MNYVQKRNSNNQFLHGEQKKSKASQLLMWKGTQDLNLIMFARKEVIIIVDNFVQETQSSYFVFSTKCC